MDNRSIGVFDSGLGGLTAVKELKKLMPKENIIYFGDTGRVPYGTRSEETILKYVRGDIKFLESFDIKLCIAACGTASAVALPSLENYYSFPLIGVVGAAAKSAVKKSKIKRIGVIGTPGTINSGKYETIIKSIDPEVRVISASCPLFVPLVENGYNSGEVARIVANDYLKRIKDAYVDTLILGCTHYPLLEDVICDIMGENVNIISPGKEVAAFAKQYLEDNGLRSVDCAGSCSFYVSDVVDNFVKLGSMFLGEKINENIRKIDIEEWS